jgi:hypothetical protein
MAPLGRANYHNERLIRDQSGGSLILRCSILLLAEQRTKNWNGGSLLLTGARWYLSDRIPNMMCFACQVTEIKMAPLTFFALRVYHISTH